MSRLTQWWRTWWNTPHSLRTEVRRQRSAEVAPAENTPIGEAVQRRRVTITGVVQEVCYPYAEHTPAVTVRIDDGSGQALLIFLGRRYLPGVAGGNVVTASGLLTMSEGMPALYNPFYRTHLTKQI